jgi:hypothetical protein
VKTIVLVLIVLLSYASNSFSQAGNYNSGNGTIVEVKKDGKGTWQIRQHVQRLQIVEFSDEKHLPIYETHSMDANAIGRLKIGDFINIVQVAEAIIDEQYHIWLNINTDRGLKGWLLLGIDGYDDAQCEDPYFNNKWEITEIIRTSKVWTIRKMICQEVSVVEVINIRDKPGLVGTTVISKIVPSENDNPQVNLVVTEATDETETIDNKNDRWLKITYKGIVGWIFGGYASVERGGYKYYTPENIILSELQYF